MNDELSNEVLPTVDEFHGVGGEYVILPNGKRVPAGSEAAQAAQPAQTAQPKPQQGD